MIGGGTFTSQNKILPGAYLNFVSAARATVNLSDRGVASFPLELDWGADGKIMEVTQEEFQKNSLKIFGYPYTSTKLSQARDLFCNAVKVLVYKLTSGGEKAANAFATAKYSGVRGNDLKVVVANCADAERSFDVRLYLGTELVDTQTVESAAELSDNDFVTWKKDAELAVTAGTALAGGTNGDVTGQSHQDYLAAVEPYAFNTIGACTDDNTTKALYAAFTKRMRDNVGAKFQCVLYDYPADYEGVINVKNNAQIVPWVTGLEAACAINKSCTNITYNGEAAVAADYTQAQLEAAIKNGEFVLHSVGTDVRVLDDINSLVSLSEEKNDLFQGNQTIRIIDQIAMDIAGLFNSKYHGKIPNDPSGRVSLWSDIVKHHRELEKLRAIEDFSEEDVIVAAGDTKKSVAVTDTVTVVNAMSQLYMTVIIQ